MSEPSIASLSDKVDLLVEQISRLTVAVGRLVEKEESSRSFTVVASATSSFPVAPEILPGSSVSQVGSCTSQDSIYNDLAKEIPVVPDFAIRLRSGLSAGSLTFKQRAERAWESGHWARFVLQGRANKSTGLHVPVTSATPSTWSSERRVLSVLCSATRPATTGSSCRTSGPLLCHTDLDLKQKPGSIALGLGWNSLAATASGSEAAARWRRSPYHSSGSFAVRRPTIRKLLGYRKYKLKRITGQGESSEGVEQSQWGFLPFGHAEHVQEDEACGSSPSVPKRTCQHGPKHGQLPRAFWWLRQLKRYGGCPICSGLHHGLGSLWRSSRTTRTFGIEQYVQDGNKWELGFQLILLEDPPVQMWSYRNPIGVQTGRTRAFSGLCPQKWATIALAYSKEMDYIQNKRQEAAKRAPNNPPPVGAVPKPKGKNAKKGGGGTPSEEGGG